jgi:hypothetical protein
MSFASSGCLDGRGHVTDVIQGIKDPEDACPVLNGQADKLYDHIVGVMPVAYQVLAAQ